MATLRTTFLDRKTLYSNYMKKLDQMILRGDRKAHSIKDMAFCRNLKSLVDELENISKSSKKLLNEFQRASAKFGDASEKTDEDDPLKSLRLNLQASGSLVVPSDEGKTFRVVIDASNFMEKEFDVKIIGRQLIVHGKHETVIDEHGLISREFTRKFDIPDDVDLDTFRTCFDYYKVLTIEASYKSGSVKDKSFEILVQQETCGKQILEPFQSLGPEFEELMKRHIKEGMDMQKFALSLLKQHQPNYVRRYKAIE